MTALENLEAALVMARLHELAEESRARGRLAIIDFEMPVIHTQETLVDTHIRPKDKSK